MARPSVLNPQSYQGLAPIASDVRETRGRLYPESESPTRTAFQRDRDRIIHSAAFRRLKHKTQVFVYHEGDYYRTRLTHSLEVSQIARAISRVLGLDEDLAEALALAHDLGHTPFGHAGEDALAACMAPYGGFDHNAHALKLVTRLEHRYAAFDGLNLTWEALEGIVKHNGPLIGRPDSKPLPEAITEYNARHDLELGTYAGAEAQVAALSDDIAYNNHDIDDGLRAGLFDIDDLEALPFVGDVFRGVRDAHPGLERGRLIHESVRRLISAMIEDVVRETQRRVAEGRLAGAVAVRGHGRPIAGFSPAMEIHAASLKSFLFKNMYRHYRVMRMVAKARRVVGELFGAFVDDPRLLPPEWSQNCGAPVSKATARTVSDYIAGMTDRFALIEHKRMFGADIEL